MRIAHVVATAPPDIGGMGTVCYAQARALARRGHSVTVFTLEHALGSTPPAAEPFTVIRLRSILKSGNAGLVPQLLWALKKFDVVHVHYPFYGGAEWVLLARWLFGTRYVVTYHMDADARGFRALVQKIYDAVLAPLILKNAHTIIAVDAEHIQHVKYAQKIAPQKIKTVMNGVDTAIFYKRASADITSVVPQFVGKNIVLFVGNLIPFKRLDILIAAMAQVKVPNAVLLIVGGGYSEAEYKKLVQTLCIEDKVYFYGQCHSQNQLAELYSISSCLVVPADRAESFSLVALEALACETPVLCSNIPGVRGRIDDGVDGLLFTPGSVRDLTDALTRFFTVSPQQRAAMGESGRRKVAAQYSWNQNVAALEEVYKNV